MDYSCSDALSDQSTSHASSDTDNEQLEDIAYEDGGLAELLIEHNTQRDNFYHAYDLM